MADKFGHNKTAESAPGDVHFAITPSDTVDLEFLPRCLFILTAGDIVVVDKLGTSITYAVLAGDIFPFRCVRVMATGTTATAAGWY